MNEYKKIAKSNWLNDILTLKFLKLTVFKKIAIVAISLALVIFVPWIVQFILNTLFLITSFVVFLIIYAIISLVKSFSDQEKSKKSGKK